MITVMPHINLSQKDTADYAILPGDPKRLDHIAAFLTDVSELSYNREFRSIRGYYHNIPIFALSTGIGGPSAAIAAEELCRIGVKNMIRIGSCGALQTHLSLGDLILAKGAIGDDGTSKSYVKSQSPILSDSLLLKACAESAENLSFSYYTGLCRSHDCLYLEEKESWDTFYSSKGILGSDMETAALFAVGKLRHVRTASILNVVVEYKKDLSENISRYNNGETLTLKGEENEILTALHAFERIEKLNDTSSVKHAPGK